MNIESTTEFTLYCNSLIKLEADGRFIAAPAGDPAGHIVFGTEDPVELFAIAFDDPVERIQAMYLNDEIDESQLDSLVGRVLESQPDLLDGV